MKITYGTSFFRKFMLILLITAASLHHGYSQHVGIGTTSPAALLHVADSNVVFTGPDTIPSMTNFNPPVQGPGSRMMWYPQKAAFRAGMVDGTQWDKDSIGRFSFAAGFNSKASGHASTALGDYAHASGVDATALGAGTIASNTSAVALGEFTTATGYAATAMGAGTISSGLTSTAMGEFTSATQYAATSMGAFTLASGMSSTAMGDHTTASGHASIAMGDSTLASGVNATAMGFSTQAIGNASTAMGFQSQATGFSTVAAGRSAIASSNSAIAIGSFVTASAIYSTAIGYYTTAMGQYATAIGTNTLASGITSTAMGYSTVASGQTSTAMGRETRASGIASVVMGYNTKASSNYTCVTGTFNDTSATNSLFEIGNGTSNTARKNAMTVLSNGNVGIGKTDPVTRLDIFLSNSAATYHPQTSLGIEHNGSHYVNLLANNDSETGILFGNVNVGSDGGITYRAVTQPLDPQALYFRAASSTRMAVYKTGNAWLQGALTQNSDARLKKNIIPISNSLAALKKLNGYFYHWNDPSRDQDQQIGLMAQEVQDVFPQLVKQNPNGDLSVNYIGLIPVLLECIKEEHKEIEELKALVQSLLMD